MADNDALGAAGDDQRARVGHALPIADLRFLVHGLLDLIDRDRFARQRRFLDAKVLDLAEAKVGRDLVAGLQQDDVAGNQFFGRDHARFPVAHGHGFGRKHVADRIQRFLRFTFLDEAEQSIDDDHAQDHRCVEPFPKEDLSHRGGQKHIDEHVVDLHEEPHERAALARGRQPVGSVFLQPLGDLVGLQSRLLIRSQPFDDLCDWLCMPRRTFRAGCGIHSDIHRPKSQRGASIHFVSFGEPVCAKVKRMPAVSGSTNQVSTISTAPMEDPGSACWLKLLN